MVLAHHVPPAHTGIPNTGIRERFGRLSFHPGFTWPRTGTRHASFKVKEESLSPLGIEPMAHRFYIKQPQDCSSWLKQQLWRLGVLILFVCCESVMMTVTLTTLLLLSLVVESEQLVDGCTGTEQ